MTFSFFKTVFVSIRFSFFVSELPLEIATRMPLLPQTLFGGMMREPKHAESPVITARKNLLPANGVIAMDTRDGNRSDGLLSNRFARLSVRIVARDESASMLRRAPARPTQQSECFRGGQGLADQQWQTPGRQ